MSNLKRISSICSFKFFLFISLVIFIFFNFFDIFLFELSRSCPSYFFYFFKNIIDPISDILDPFYIILICGLSLILNLNIKVILRNKKKLDILKSKTGFKTEKIHELFRYLSLVSKHFIFSLAAAGIICNLLKYILGVSRPKYFFLQGYERINFFNLEHKANSFPSGHTQAAFTIAILLMIYLNRYYIIILIVASLMALSRIFMSMHFPSDLIAGAYVGSIVPYLLYKSIFMERIESI